MSLALGIGANTAIFSAIETQSIMDLTRLQFLRASRIDRHRSEFRDTAARLPNGSHVSLVGKSTCVSGSENILNFRGTLEVTLTSMEKYVLPMLAGNSVQSPDVIVIGLLEPKGL
jgi:hypothetical protein